MKSLGAALQNPKLRSLFSVAQELNLLDESTRDQSMAQLASQCTHRKLAVHCEDPSVDLCPSGHLIYGLVTLGILLLPGAVFAVSEFLHRRAFGFGGALRKGGEKNKEDDEERVLGQNLNRVVKFALLPFYVVVMAPLAIFVTVLQ